MWTWLLVAALAQPSVEPVEGEAVEGEVPVPKGPDQAEYNRLTQELEKLAERNAWAGVERTWGKLVLTQIPPSYEDLSYAANAARALGDTAAARERWLMAKERKEDPMIFDALFEIDQNYGTVALQCDPGVGWELTTEQRPFQPDRIRSVEFAAAAIADSCAFEGMIPVGTYAFCGDELVVKAGQPTVKRDERGRLPPKGKK